MTKKFWMTNVAVVLAVAGNAVAALATPPVVDQTFVAPTDLGANINEGFRYIAQTYTAGVSGTLAGVNVDITGFQNNHPLRISIEDTTSGTPNSTVLGSTTLVTSGSSLSDLVTFTEIIPQTQGSIYSIVVDYPTAQPAGYGQFQGIWYGTTGDGYTGGDLFASNDLVSWHQFTGEDVHFRTYVTPGTPEPSSLLVFAVAATGLSILTLKRKTRTRTYNN